jgi:hypothetical protein
MCFPAEGISSGLLFEIRVVVVGANLAGAASGVVIEAYPPSNFREL